MRRRLMMQDIGDTLVYSRDAYSVTHDRVGLSYGRSRFGKYNVIPSKQYRFEFDFEVICTEVGSGGTQNASIRSYNMGNAMMQVVNISNAGTITEHVSKIVTAPANSDSTEYAFEVRVYDINATVNVTNIRVYEIGG